MLRLHPSEGTQRPKAPLLLALLATAAVIPQIGIALLANAEPVVIDLRVEAAGGAADPMVAVILGTLMLACAIGAACIALLRLPWSFREGTAVLAAAPWALYVADLGAGAVVHHSAAHLHETLTPYFAAAGVALVALHAIAAVRGEWPRNWLDAAWGIEKVLVGGFIAVVQLLAMANPGGALPPIAAWGTVVAFAALVVVDVWQRLRSRKTKLAAV